MPFQFDHDGTDGLTITRPDLDIKIERHSNSSCSPDIDESCLDELLIRKNRKPSAQNGVGSGSIVCILCLRKCPPESEVTFSSNVDLEPDAIDVTEAENKLNKALDMLIGLQHCAMCSTCWQMIELITDFRQCCEKASEKLEVFPMGLDYGQQKDEWMAESTLNAIELRQTVQKHLDHLDEEEARAKKAADDQNRATEEQTNDEEVMEDVPFEMGQDEVPDDAQEYQPNTEPVKPTTTIETQPVPLEIGDYQAEIHTCETCGRNFDGHQSIRVHKTHCKPGAPSKERYFACPICTATFLENSGLTFHLNKHKGIRPFKCRKFCDHTFFSNYARIKHERRMCDKEGRICDTCGQNLKNEASLKTHLQNVHGEAKYACNTCGRKFTSQRYLRFHKRVHSEERKYVCKICDKRFKAPFSLKVHLRTHTQEMPFACHLCEQVFNYKVSLKNHIERYHESDLGSDGTYGRRVQPTSGCSDEN